MARKAKAKKKVLPISIEGELTIFRVGELKEAILPVISSADEIEIDLSRVTEMDGAGMQLLMSAKLGAWQQNKALHYYGHSAVVTEAIDLCGLSTFFGDPIIISSNPA